MSRAKHLLHFLATVNFVPLCQDMLRFEYSHIRAINVHALLELIALYAYFS